MGWVNRYTQTLMGGILLTAVTLFFFASSHGQRLEEEVGLALLYLLRGERKPPGKTVIVNLDDESSKDLGLSEKFSSWPRSIHAQMVDELTKYDVSVIAFDVHFAESRDTIADRRFAESVRRAGNVVLVERLKHRTIIPEEQGSSIGNIEVEMLVPPISLLVDSALAQAPFPLPKLPVRVDSAWLFRNSSGGIPTLPAVVFQASTLHLLDDLQLRLFPKSQFLPHSPSLVGKDLERSGLTERMRRVRIQVRKIMSERRDSSSGAIALPFDTVDTIDEGRMKSLLRMYGGVGRTYIDFYGRPGSFPILTYHDILGEGQADSDVLKTLLHDKVVFVGAAKSTWSNQKDGFYTVYSRKDGLDISGVEIAATVFSNLHENRHLRRIDGPIAYMMLLACIIVVCGVSFLLQPLYGLPLLLLYVGCGLFCGNAIFRSFGLWLPVIIPFVLLPLFGYLGGTVGNYLITRKERRHISKALGYYLPNNVVNELAKDLSFIKKGEKRVYATCLMTDAQNYTTLSERMSPEDLSTHMKEYYRFLFREVKKNQGVVGNIIGDAMLALWPAAAPDNHQLERSCKAALEVIEAVDRFNDKYPDYELPTRVGIHSGYLLMDNVGAEDHYEYAPVGDIVNTASRIEGLNKSLATKILVSAETVHQSEGMEFRELGTFLLGGKTRPVDIFELCSSDDLDADLRTLFVDAFPSALNMFRSHNWSDARAEFELCLDLVPADGPSLFYLQLCQSYLQTPPDMDNPAIVRMTK